MPKNKLSVKLAKSILEKQTNVTGKEQLGKNDNVVKVLKKMKECGCKKQVEKSHFSNKTDAKSQKDEPRTLDYSKMNKPKQEEPRTLDYSKMESPKKQPNWKEEADKKTKEGREAAIKRAGGPKAPSGKKL